MSCFFFFNDTATTEIYTLSLHDALPIFGVATAVAVALDRASAAPLDLAWTEGLVTLTYTLHPDLATELEVSRDRSEEHTSELQSRQYLVCRLLLEKKKI